MTRGSQERSQGRARARRETRGVSREKVWTFVRDRLLSGEPPTVREVQQALGFRAVQTARQHLEALVAAGRLEAGRGRARGYRLAASRARETVRRGLAWVPLLGRVQAGALTEAVEVGAIDAADDDNGNDGCIGYVGYVPASAASVGAHFALVVQGESMTGAGILPGDVVVVRRRVDVRSGDIVVARVGEDATVKRLHVDRARGLVELRAENPAFPTIVLDPEAAGDDEMAILGKVVEVRRTLDGGHSS